MTEVSFERQCLALVRALIDAYLKKDKTELYSMSDTLSEDFTFISEGLSNVGIGLSALLEGSCLSDSLPASLSTENMQFHLLVLSPDTNVIFGSSEKLRCSCVCSRSTTNTPLINSLHLSVPYDCSMALEIQLDSLTGLYNRRYTELLIRQQLSLGGCHCLFMIDVDRFKMINDTLGHPTGDMILKTTAEILSRELGSDAIIGRVGGDEFLALIPCAGAEKERQHEATAQSIISSMKALLQAYSLSQSCSIGIVLTDKPDSTFDLLYRAADRALYEAKDSGRSKYSISRL